MVSDKVLDKPPKSAPTLADLFVKTIGADALGFADVLERQPWARDERELGAEFAE